MWARGEALELRTKVTGKNNAIRTILFTYLPLSRTSPKGLLSAAKCSFSAGLSPNRAWESSYICHSNFRPRDLMSYQQVVG